MTPASDRRDDERGAILILALAFLVIVLAITTVLLHMALTTSRTLVPYRADRVMRFNADAAVDRTITLLRRQTALGTKGSSFVTGGATPSGTYTYYIEEDQPAERRQYVNGSFVTVDWGVPADVATSGTKAPDGGQSPREVEIVVSCRGQGGDAAGRTQLTCGGSGPRRVVATVRVRFDVDYGTDPVHNVPFPLAERANVPKIISWKRTI